MLQYLSHLVQRDDSFKKPLMLEKIEGKRRKGLQKTTWLDSITDLMGMSLSKLQEIVKDGGACCVAIHGVTKIRRWPTD